MNYNEIVIGERIKAARCKPFNGSDGFSQSGLAIALGLDSTSRTTIRKWERGEVLPSLEYLLKMCELFGCELGYLLGEHELPTRAATDIQQQTGLSLKAIEHLHITQNSHSELTPVLNLILEEPFFFEFLNEIGKYIGAAKATSIVNGVQGELLHQNEISLGHIEDFEYEYANKLSMIARSSQHGYFTKQYLEKYAAQAFFYISKPESEQESLNDLLSELSQLSFPDLCEYRSTIVLSQLLKNLNHTQSLKSESEI